MTKKAKIIELSSWVGRPPEDEPGTIGVVEALQAGDVVRLAHSSKFSHVVQKTGLAFEREMATAQVMTEDLALFMKDPIRVILGAPQEGEAPRQTLHLVNNAWDKKAESLERFEAFLGTVKGARRIRDQAQLVADELYTNATKVGRRHAMIAPNIKQRGGTVEFFAESDGERLIIGCRDSYGELSFNQVLDRLTLCFENGIVNSIKQGENGAGIGSFLVFNTCVGYYCAVESGRATVVCVALPLGVSDDELAGLPKNIHLVSA